MTTTTRTYHAVGDVRGSCGHRHQTKDAAQRCAGRDAAACARLPGGHSYSDRVVRAYFCVAGRARPTLPSTARGRSL